MEIEERYEALKLKSIKLKTQVAQHLKTGKENKLQYEEKKKQLEVEKESSIIQSTAIDMLKEIVDKMSQQHIEKIVNLLTYGLSTIFYDKDYSVEVILGDKRNAKTAEFQLVEKTEDKVIRSSFDDGIGGGVVAVTGVILQVYYVGMLNLAPIIFVDEGFSQVSSEYITPLMKFIEELAETKKFIFVLVTHDERLMNGAVRTYKVETGVVTRVEKKGGGEDGGVSKG